MDSENVRPVSSNSEVKILMNGDPPADLKSHSPLHIRVHTCHSLVRTKLGTYCAVTQGLSQPREWAFMTAVPVRPPFQLCLPLEGGQRSRLGACSVSHDLHSRTTSLLDQLRAARPVFTHLPSSQRTLSPGSLPLPGLGTSPWSVTLYPDYHLLAKLMLRAAHRS